MINFASNSAVTGAIKPDVVYLFTKSGNMVRTIEPAEPYRGIPCWTVERTTGASAGKRMVAPESALVAPESTCIQ